MTDRSTEWKQKNPERWQRLFGRIAHLDTFVGGMERWVLEGIPPGHFGRAVLNNDLVDAFSRADENNRAAMHTIVLWLYNDCPSPAWIGCGTFGLRGNYFEEWQEMGGMLGLVSECERGVKP